MRIMTILGTRPEIIRLSRIIKKLDECTEHTLVHTGQNYLTCLNDIFFDELEVRKPDFYLDAKAGTMGGQIAIIFEEIEKLLSRLMPDRVLILGDTNSGLAAVVAERMGIPVYHMEAGNRCFDTRVPEEINRRVIDSVSSYALPYTQASRENLLKEGIHKSRIYVSGNPIYEVLGHYSEKIDERGILDELGVAAGKFFLVTAHRAENVDDRQRLLQIMEGLRLVEEKYRLPVICSVHPRTRSRLEQFGLGEKGGNIRLMEPFGFFDFIKLEKNALCVLTDSGTVQEECCIFKVPAVTVRDTTERPETIQCGSNILSGVDAGRIVQCTEVMMSGSRDWNCPEGYVDGAVSDKVVKYILGGKQGV